MVSRLSRVTVMAAVVFVMSFACSPWALAAGKQQKFTGEVGDAMCGAKHMEGTPAECTRTCVSHGSKYALVIGEKLYVLETSNQTVLATLDQQAGKRVTVSGTLNGDTIEVASVAPAK